MAAAILKKAEKAVVKINCQRHCSYAEDMVGTTRSTGFIVNAAKGIFVTAAHSISEGPCTIIVTFAGGKETHARVLARHPTQDFSIAKYDPNDGPANPQEIRLAPENLDFGMSVFLVSKETSGSGNLTISSALIEETNACPKILTNDFQAFSNTCYVRASTVCLGSLAVKEEGKYPNSGSPVLDENGNAVALQIAGWGSGGHLNSNVFLPLDDIVKTLESLESGIPLKRGCIQAAFNFDELSYAERHRVPRQVIEDIRVASVNHSHFRPGVLVVARVIKGGPASKATLRPGDILITGGGQLITSFRDLERILGNSIGSPLTLGVYRDNRELILKTDVQDLATLIPRDTFSINNCVFHNISMKLAYGRNVQLNSGVYLANDFYSVPGGSILTKLGSHMVQSPGDLRTAINAIAMTPRTDAIATFLNIKGKMCSSVVEIPTVRYLETYQIQAEDGDWRPLYEPSFTTPAPNGVCPKPPPVRTSPLALQVEVLINAPFFIASSAQWGCVPGLLVRDRKIARVITTRKSSYTKIAEIRIRFSGITISGKVSEITDRHVWIDIPQEAIPYDADLPVFETDPVSIRPKDDVTLLTFDMKTGETDWVETKVVKKEFLQVQKNEHLIIFSGPTG
ncbi:hypothetical protein TWF481_002618 [Arthrobotrys musiformis]|uniref:PDZ domain-containing protein n=1 Tax=Arthrobotrys musiformis TaxID=47236 RepID=A0AAV9VQU8_9PEZI